MTARTTPPDRVKLPQGDLGLFTDGAELTLNGEIVGLVTSGGFAPTLIHQLHLVLSMRRW